MEVNRSAIQLMAVIIAKQHLEINSVLDLIQILNNSSPSCKDIITIFQDVFKHQKSSKILVAVNVKIDINQALQYMVKNCNIRFHVAANRQSFQKRLLSLLNRIRGKTSILKQINSNTDNWCRIEAKVLYIIQLWYDTFILEENKYPFIINTYKILRKQNITFPPRSKNEKNLMLVNTQSPIFDNIEQIAQQDQKKFNKKLNALGLNHLQKKMEKNIETVQKKQNIERKVGGRKQVNIDEISEKIAIIQSTENCTRDTLKVIEQIKQAIEYGVVKSNEEKYWKEVKSAAQKLVQDWQANNAELVKQQERMYLQRKLGMIGGSSENKANKQQSSEQKKVETNQFDLLQDLQHAAQKNENNASIQSPTKGGEMNLLDL